MSRQAAGLVVVVLLCGAGIALSNPEADGDAGDATAEERVKLAREVYAEKMAQLNNNELRIEDLEHLEIWSRNVLAAELAAAAGAEERTKAHEGHVKRTTRLEEVAKSYARTGQGRQSDALGAEFYRLQAEADLAALKRK